MNDIDKIKEIFKGLHISIDLFPAGGMMEVEGCEECNTDENIYEYATWKAKRGEDVYSAVDRICDKLKQRGWSND